MLVSRVRGTVHGVVGASLHLLWYLDLQTGGALGAIGAYAAAGAASSRATRCLNASCAAAVTGPGRVRQRDLVDRGDRHHLAHREAMNASSAARTSSSVHGASVTSSSSSSRARVIESRIPSASGGVCRRPPCDPEERPRRALEHAAVRRHEQRLVGALLLRQAAGEHVRRVGERLEPVEHARRHVGDGRHARASRAARGSGSAIAMRRPPRVTTRRRSDSGSPACSSSASASAPQRVEVRLEPQAGAGAPEAREVVLERERAAAVDAHHLEPAVAAQQPVVGDGDDALRRPGVIAPSTLASHIGRGSLAARYRDRSRASRGARSQRRASRRPPRARARRVRVPLPRRHGRRGASDPGPPLRLGREGVVGAAGRLDRAVREGRDRALSRAARRRRRHRVARGRDERLGRARQRRAARAGAARSCWRRSPASCPTSSPRRPRSAAAACWLPFSQAIADALLELRGARLDKRALRCAMRLQVGQAPAPATLALVESVGEARFTLDVNWDPDTIPRVPRAARLRGARPLAARSTRTSSSRSSTTCARYGVEVAANAREVLDRLRAEHDAAIADVRRSRAHDAPALATEAVLGRRAAPVPARRAWRTCCARGERSSPTSRASARPSRRSRRSRRTTPSPPS